MRAPEFWQNPPDAPGFCSYFLGPLSSLYAKATAQRVRKPPEFIAPVPVICVGNIGVGGTGKTPTVMALT